ncbi:MAG: hydroxyacylglutathione hydrolase [Gammaproteobacteria bacterium]|nr:MAG: hydroxyacylglutathione hydrolase [Gammaproteobacteria bacterium]
MYADFTEHGGALRVCALPAFQDNYIWCLRRGDGPWLVVDPGDAACVERLLAQEGGGLWGVLVTHHHADHCGGVPALVRGHAPRVWGPAREAIAGVSIPVAEPGTVEAGPLALRFAVLDVPGHTLGHVAYWAAPADGAPLLFCGDTLFAAGCGRLFEGRPEQLYASLDKLARLPDETRVYCAHEYTVANLRFALAVEPDNPALRGRLEQAAAARRAGRPTLPSTLALERATNPFLRCAEPAVRAAAERWAGRPLDDPVAVFAALRRWKDGFRG